MRPERNILEDHREVALLRSEQQLAIRERVEWVPELSAAVGLDDLDLQRLAVGHGADHRGDLREVGCLARPGSRRAPNTSSHPSSTGRQRQAATPASLPRRGRRLERLTETLTRSCPNRRGLPDPCVDFGGLPPLLNFPERLKS